MSMLAYLGAFGPAAQAFSAVIVALGAPFLGKPGRKTALVSALCDLASHALEEDRH